MKNIIVIAGFGNIGYRHYQSIKSRKNSDIFIVDKLNQSLNRYGKYIKKKNYFNDIGKLKIKNISVLIIATDVKPRIKILMEFIKNYKVENIILEKIVFNNYKELKSVYELSKEKKLSVFFNYPRQTYKFYKTLKKNLNTNFNKIIVEGYNWNMGSNFMHFIYLFVFLTGNTNLSLFKLNLHKKIYTSKRDGYHEIKGIIGFKNSYNQSLLIMDNKNKKFLIKILTDNKQYIIDETNDLSIVSDYLNKKKIKVKKSISVKQSTLTNKCVNEIINEKPTIPNLSDCFKIENIYFKTKKKISEIYLKKNIYFS